LTVFDQYAQEYDRWFDENVSLFQAELNALSRVVPKSGKGIEIGAGTGRFTQPLRIRLGVELSRPMALIAHGRGLEICQAMGEKLPFSERQFDYVLLVTTICFVADILVLLQEIHRVLVPGGVLVNAFIDKESALGRVYESQKGTNKFYRQAHFYSAEQVAEYTRQAGYSGLVFSQTILGLPAEKPNFDAIRDGTGEGAFVILLAKK